MRIPFGIAAGLAGVHAREFAIGWANGAVRFHNGGENPFPIGSTKRAASAAAMAFLKERSQ